MSAGETVAQVILRLRNEASGGLDEAADSARRAREEVDDVAAASGRASNAGERLGDVSGRVGQSSAKLAGALGMVSPEAAGLAMGLADVADVGEVAGAAFQAIGLSGASLLAILGPIAVAAAALGAAYFLLNQELKEAEANIKAQQEAAQAMQKAHEQWRGSLDELNDEVAIANGELDENTAAVNRRITAWRESRKEQEQILQQEVYLTQAIHDSGKATVDDIANYHRAVAVLKGYRDTTERAATQIEFLNDAKNASAAASKAEAAAAKAAAEAQKLAAEAAAKVAAEIAAYNAERKEQEAAEVAAAAYILDGADAMTKANAAYAKQLELIRAWEDEGVDANVLLQARTRALDDFTEAQRKANEESGRTATGSYTTGVTTVDYTGGGTTTAAGDTLADVAGAASDPLSAIAAADPTGIAGGIIAAGQAMASLEGTLGTFTTEIENEDGTVTIVDGTGLRGLLEDITTGLEGAGETVGLFIADLAGTLAPALIGAIPDFLSELIGAIPEMLQGVFEALPDLAVAFMDATILLAPRLAIALVETLTDPQVWLNVAKALGEGIVGIFTSAWENLVALLKDALDVLGDGEGGVPTIVEGEWWENAGSALGDMFKGRNVFESLGDAVSGGGWFDGSYATGSAYVAQTGMRLVHEGEVISHDDGRPAQPAARMRSMGGGPQVTINVQGGIIGPGVARQIVRELNRTLGTAGAGLAWAAGS